MARPIWSGFLSFGLLNIPVSLMSGERSTNISFRMLDSRDKKPIRFERVNAETGEEVPWNDIVKAFEYEKGSYVVIEKEDIASAAPESHESVDVEAFVPLGSIGTRFFDKPYILVPGKKAEKGYVLLRDTLQSTGMVGIARVVIRTREYLAAVMPEDDALVLMLLRYPQELVDPEDYKLPTGKRASYRITDAELKMAKQLVESMATDWKPDDYHDEFRERLSTIIKKRIKSKASTTRIDPPVAHESAASNVVDFMALLEKSLGKKSAPSSGSSSGSASVTKLPTKKTAAKKTAAKKSAAKKAAKKATKKTAAKKSTAKKTAARKSA